MENLSWKSPFEILYKKPPVYEDLGTTGCLCFAHKVREQDKFEPKALKCVLLGYTPSFKGYKLYDLTTHKIFHSKDVTFRETMFPFKLKSNTQDHSINNGSSYSLFPQLDFSQLDLTSSSPHSSLIPHSQHTIPDSLLSSLSPQNLEAPNQPHTTPLEGSSDFSPIVSSPKPSLDTVFDVPLRRSQRPKHPPAWLKDFICMNNSPPTTDATQ